jgi:cell division inhibitor SulA
MSAGSSAVESAGRATGVARSRGADGGRRTADRLADARRRAACTWLAGRALTEILMPVDGVGELRLVLPTFARLTQGHRPVVLIAPPYLPCAMGWRQQGVNLHRLTIVDAEEKQVLWAAEQCLRSGSCAAVLAWPHQADDRSLRRLQVAADTGRALAFVFRDRKHLTNASPASLRLELTTTPSTAIWVRKCRGGNVPTQAIPFDHVQRLSSEGRNQR